MVRFFKQYAMEFGFGSLALLLFLAIHDWQYRDDVAYELQKFCIAGAVWVFAFLLYAWGQRSDVLPITKTMLDLAIPGLVSWLVMIVIYALQFLTMPWYAAASTLVCAAVWTWIFYRVSPTLWERVQEADWSAGS
jgi:hypothetical protein